MGTNDHGERLARLEERMDAAESHYEKHATNVDYRLSRIEKMIWMAAGGLAVLVFILKFFGKG